MTAWMMSSPNQRIIALQLDPDGCDLVDAVGRGVCPCGALLVQFGSIAPANSGVGALLATIRNMHMTVLDKFLAVVLIAIGVYAGWLFLDDLQYGLADVRRWLDPAERDPATRGREILYLHKFILVASAVVVVWAVLFKLP